MESDGSDPVEVDETATASAKAAVAAAAAASTTNDDSLSYPVLLRSLKITTVREIERTCASFTW